MFSFIQLVQSARRNRVQGRESRRGECGSRILSVRVANILKFRLTTCDSFLILWPQTAPRSQSQRSSTRWPASGRESTSASSAGTTSWSRNDQSLNKADQYQLGRYSYIATYMEGTKPLGPGPYEVSTGSQIFQDTYSLDCFQVTNGICRIEHATGNKIFYSVRAFIYSPLDQSLTSSGTAVAAVQVWRARLHPAPRPSCRRRRLDSRPLRVSRRVPYRVRDPRQRRRVGEAGRAPQAAVPPQESDPRELDPRGHDSRRIHSTHHLSCAGRLLKRGTVELRYQQPELRRVSAAAKRW